MKKITTILFLVFICFLFNSSLAYSEYRVVLKIEGINGDSILEGHKDEIDILDWSWQMSSTYSAYSAERPIVRPLIVKKKIDKASPHISLSLLKGETKPEAILYVLVTGTPIFDILRITMSSVRFVNVSAGYTPGDSHLIESVALAFSKVCYSYSTYDAEGAPAGTIERCFNIETNVEE